MKEPPNTGYYHDLYNSPQSTPEFTLRNLENLVATRSQFGRYYNQKETNKYISICQIMDLGFSNKRHIKM
jgi:hypothetical protein